jgi:hypothetical protein
MAGGGGGAAGPGLGSYGHGWTAVHTLRPSYANIIIHMGFTTQLEEAECSGPAWWGIPPPPEGVCRMRAGEAPMPVKTTPDPGHGGRWQRLHAVTLSKALPLQTASSHSCCSGETQI